MLNIEKKLDKAFQALSANKKCHYCNNPASEIHHLVRRSYKLYRWNRWNALPICRQHHFDIHSNGLKEPKLPFEIEDFHQYKINHCLSDADFLRMKCEEYGIKYTKPVTRKIRTTDFYKKVMEFKRKQRKEVYQKKKAFAK